MKEQLKILQPKQKDREDSFWYDGDIAQLGKYVLVAVGEIRIILYEADGSTERYDDEKAREEAINRGYTDKDIINESIVAEWLNNNWFEVVATDGSYGYSNCGDVTENYDSGIDLLKEVFRRKGKDGKLDGSA